MNYQIANLNNFERGDNASSIKEPFELKTNRKKSLFQKKEYKSDHEVNKVQEKSKDWNNFENDED